MCDNKNIGKRLRDARKGKGFSQGQFAKRLEYSQNHISELELGNKNFTGRLLRHIEREFNISEHWLKTGQGNKYLETSSDKPNTKNNNNYYRIPVIKISTYLTDSACNLNMKVLDYYTLPTNVIKEAGIMDSKSIFSFYTEDNSMLPEITKDELVFITKEQTHLQNHKIYLFEIANQAILKKVNVIDNETINLESNNLVTKYKEEKVIGRAFFRGNYL